MSTFRFISLTLVLLVTLVWASPALADQTLCLSTGGTWDGSDADNGVCTYAAGSSIAISSCGSASFPYRITYVGGVEEKTECVGHGRTAVTSDGPMTEFFTLSLGRGKNGWVNFPAGTCNVNCSINTQMPKGAKDDIIVTPLATLYVRVDGGFGTGSYQVCFENPYGAPRTIYQFTGGTWWPIARGTGTTICGTGSGDSAFYLGGKP